MSPSIVPRTLLGIVWEGINQMLGIRVMASVLIVLFAILTFHSINRSFSGE